MFPNWFEAQQHFFERNVPRVPALTVLQIGAYTGDATQWLLDNRDIDLICDVDTWEGSKEDAHESIDFNAVQVHYLSRFRGDPRVDPSQMTSDTFFAHDRGDLGDDPEFYDFIYIDGDHTALQTCLDGLNAWRFLKKGGVMAFDDYQWHLSNPNVPIEDCPKKGIDAVLFVLGTRCEIIEIGYQLWIKKC